MASRAEEQRLVGREGALAVLRATAAAAAAGRGGTLLVTGEPGVGKTALLAALSAEAADDGARVLRGQCWDGDAAPPYWPWVQVVRAGLAAGGDPGRARLLLPEQASPPRAPDTDGAARFALFDAVACFLGELAERGTVLVVLDDLHWADEGSLRLLDFAARHLASRAVVLLGAYRDEEAGEALRRLAGATEQLALAGLPPADVATLMTSLTGSAPPPEQVRDVWRRTGGNPFLVRELSRLQLAQPPGTVGAPSSPALVETVRDILERRLARLSQPCAELLDVAAAAGPQVRVDVLAGVLPDARDLTELLEEAVRARVLVASDGATEYRYSHDLFRETVLAALPPGRRTQLHLAVGRTLEALRRRGVPVHPAELAAHFSAAARAAPRDAVLHSRLAAEEATARLAFEEARGHCERAMAALELVADPDPVDRLEVLLQLGAARNLAGDVDSARTAYRDAAALARAVHDSTRFARAALGVHALGWRESHEEAIAVLDEAARALPRAPTELRSRVLAALARDLHYRAPRRDHERASALAEEAVDVARRVGDRGTLAFALLALHDARWRPGTARVRLPVVEEMLAAADDAADPELVAQARLLRATALLELGDPGGPAELREFCRQSEGLGHARARYLGLSRRATLALLEDDLVAAAQLARAAVELGEDVGEPDARGVHETLMWAVDYAGGVDREQVVVGPRLDSQPWPGLPLLEAVLHVAAGDLDAARGALARLRLDDLPRTHDLEVLAFAAHAVVAAGTDQQRGDLYALLRPYAGTHVVVGGCASYFGAVDHQLGRLARCLGRPEEARRHFRDAAALHERLGAPGFAERSRWESGDSRPDPTGGVGVLRREGDVWRIAYGGRESHLPDAKGLRDLAVLLAAPGEAVSAVELHTGRPSTPGADEVLDARAKAAYRRRLVELEADIDEAEEFHDTARAEQARLEREALLRELSHAVGLGGRDRRLGDERERARKAVTGRVRDAIDRIDRVDSALADHLRRSVHTGAWCSYTPAEPVRWSR